jgi:hypothetical protein
VAGRRAAPPVSGLLGQHELSGSAGAARRSVRRRRRPCCTETGGPIFVPGFPSFRRSGPIRPSPAIRADPCNNVAHRCKRCRLLRPARNRRPTGSSASTRYFSAMSQRRTMNVNTGYPSGRISKFPERQSKSSRYTISPLTVFVIVVLISSILLIIHNSISIGFMFERNYNEGWNVYNTQRIINHEVIYDSNYWRVNNYPIVSFLIVGSLNLLVHDLLLSGRLVALISFAAVGVLAAIATRRLGGDRIDGIFGGGCALGFCYLIAPAWVATDDPQTLAEAITLAGFVIYLSRPMSRRTLLVTASLIMLAGFTKHNLVAIPVAITLDLAIRSPRKLPFWLVACSCSAIALLGLTKLIAGGTFFEHLLSPRTFIWYNAHYHLMKFLRMFKLPILLVLLCSWRLFTRDRLVLAGYGTISIAAGAVLSGWEGTSYNMFQDAAAFLAIAAGVLLHELRRPVVVGAPRLGLHKISLVLVPILLALPILTKSPKALGDVYQVQHLLQNDRQLEQSFLADAAYVSERHGPAICESLLLCYQAHQPFTLDPFNSRQYILAGKLDQSDLIRRVAAQEFTVIQLSRDICDDQTSSSCHILNYPRKFNRFTDEFLYAVDHFYRIERRSQNGIFYVPK